MSRDSWIFLFAGVSALGALVGLLVRVSGWLPTMKPMAWVILTIVVSIALSGWGLYRSVNMVPGFEEGAKLQPVNDQTFVNCEVTMDGKAFDRCRFEHVTLVYKGRRSFSLTNCDFLGPIILKPDNPSFYGLVALQKGIGMLQDNVRYFGDGLRNVESPSRPQILSSKPQSSSSPDTGASPR